MPPTSGAAPGVELELEIDADPEVQTRVDEPTLRSLVQSLVGAELGPGRYALGLHLVDEDAIQELNRSHREMDAPTDVLSFPLHDPNGMRFVVAPNEPVLLGDVVISYPRALEQAREYGHTPEREIAYLVAHGLLHILGFDHEEEVDRVRMREREEAALGRLGLTR